MNFLLPLCDWLFGTLKLEATREELRRWPRFEDAKRLPGAAPEQDLAVARAS